MLKTVNALTRNEWDAFVLAHGPKSGRFLQSWMWGEFQKSVGETVDRVAWTSNNEPVAIAQIIQKKIQGFGTYGYVPRGPIDTGDEELDMTSITESNLFLRIEPTHITSHGRGMPRPYKSHDVQPSHTLITDLSQSEESLLLNMHEKTRYNIRLAEKKGVKIEIGKATLEEVWLVFEMTSARDEFRLHGKEYYKKMLESTNAFLAIAKHNDDILAANVLIDFGNTRTYLHGASSNLKRNLMAPYLLHFELMRDAKKHGIHYYDWWGVAPIDAPSTHPWSGISRFKRGFGGEEISYPGTWDLVTKPVRYFLYRFLRRVRSGK